MEASSFSVCAVIVTFNPNTENLQQTLLALQRQTRAVVVVDNGSDLDIQNWLRGQAVKAPIELILLGQNMGIAHAQNTGIQWAIGHAFTHVLMMDQDSIPGLDMVKRLAAAMTAMRAAGLKVAAVGPCCRDPRSGVVATFARFINGKFVNAACPPDAYLPVSLLIASGSLIAAETFQEVGLMEDGLFIDHVDHEWGLRAHAKGYGLYAVGDAFLTHNLGDRTMRIWLGRWREVPLHSPLRHYYMVRNTILLLKRDYIPADCKAFLLRQLAFIFCFFCLFASPRHRHFFKMAQGLIHGLRNVTGAYQGD